MQIKRKKIIFKVDWPDMGFSLKVDCIWLVLLSRNRAFCISNTDNTINEQMNHLPILIKYFWEKNVLLDF
jgi:hypothetical protein